jgi:hypothetical protein
VQPCFRVTHPFHPLFGREFVLVDRRNNWGEDSVYYHDETTGRLRRLPAAWTSKAASSLFEAISAGRSHFRPTDLLQLADLIVRLEQVQPPCGSAAGQARWCQANHAAHVK